MSATRIEAVLPEIEAAPPRIAPPCAMVVFGASGDLTQRKLLPALYNLAAAGALTERFALVGVARTPMSNDEFRESMRQAVERHSRRRPDPEVWRSFAPRLSYLSGEFSDDRTFGVLRDELERVDAAHRLEGNRLFYLATPPSEFAPLLGKLQAADLIRLPFQTPWSRVIIEKPFGRDLRSAHELNELVSRTLRESQVFRIDHYLGKETVQNILVLRFANSIFETFWNRKYVDYVQICVAETQGVGRRGRFYDQTGVLRDVVQNHMLELLALTAMEPPTTGSAEDIRSEKLKVLQALRRMDETTLPRDIVLGQYHGYGQEPDVSTGSKTPTFAAVRVHVDNWRWQGVPFYLRTGKKLKRQASEIAIHLQPVPLCLFNRDDVCPHLRPNVLGIRIQPDEGIQLEFVSKIPGDQLQVGTVKMDMRYVDTFGGEAPEAYERLLLDAALGDLTLFSRRDWVEASWAWIDSILSHSASHPEAVQEYEPGSWGPSAAANWIAQEQRSWREL